MSTENVTTLGMPYVLNASTIAERKIACTSFSDGIFMQNAAVACAELNILAYVLQIWEKMMVTRPQKVWGPYLIQQTTRLIREDVTNPPTNVAPPNPPLLYADVALVDSPEGAASYFPDTGIYRIGHYAWIYFNEFGNMFMTDLQLLRQTNQRVHPPDDGPVGIFLHLYPGFTVEVEMVTMPFSKLSGLHVVTSSMDFHINPLDVQPQPYLIAP